MRARLGAWCVACVLAAAAVPANAAGERQVMPFELGRSLQMLQEAVAQGSGTAQGAQQKMLAIMSDRFLKADPSVWKDRKNATAAVLHALSGGDPRVLRKLIDRESFDEADLPLVKGALAYSEGRIEEAASLLSEIDAQTVAPSIGGYVALAQAVLAAPKDAKRATRLLDLARLLMPGTLVEEAALRREIFMAVQDGEIERFERLSRQHLTRYGRSIYTSGFRNQFAEAVIKFDYGAGPAPRLDVLDGMLATLESQDRCGLYVAIARKGALAGKVEITRFAAEQIATEPEGSAEDKLRAQLYASSAMIVTADFEPALRQLKAVDTKSLDKEDAVLLRNALALAEKMRKGPDPALGNKPAPPLKDTHHRDKPVVKDPVPDMIERVNAAIEQADALLKQETP